MEEIKWYENNTLDMIKNTIKSNMNTACSSFNAIGYYLKNVRDRELYTQDGYNSIWEFAQVEFGISKSSASRFMAINDKFSVDGNSPVLLVEYKSFSSSKLSEMLTLSDSQLVQVTPKMTRDQIRELKQHKEELQGKLLQPELPRIRNNDRRKEFIDNYTSWPVWIDQPLTGERYYRYDLSSKVAMVVKVSRKHVWENYKESKNFEYAAEQYYLLGIKASYGQKFEYIEDPTRTFYECNTNKSTLVDYLKEIQKNV